MEETPLGPMELLVDDIVSNTLRAGKHWDPHVYDALEPHLTGVVIDVGANVGALTLRFAKEASYVDAFEPNPAMVSCLRSNASSNVTVFGRGLYSKATWLHPMKIAGYSESSWPWIPVERNEPGDIIAAPYDPPATYPVGAIKVDAQGADLHCLLGLETVITRDHPAIVFEFEEELAKMHGHSWTDYEKVLSEWGYKWERLASGWDFLAVPR